MAFQPLIGFGKGDSLGKLQIFLLVGFAQFQKMGMEGAVNKAFRIHLRASQAAETISGKGHEACQFHHIFTVDAHRFVSCHKITLF